MNVITLPNSDEYASFYAGYVERAEAKDDVFAALSQLRWAHFQMNRHYFAMRPTNGPSRK